jgi:hypothetical protein
MTRRLLWCLLAVVLGGGLVVAGCSAGDEDEDGTAASGGDAAALDEGGGESVEGGGTGGDAVALPEGQPISLERSLVFTAQVRLEAEDVHRTADRAVAIAETAGGFAADDRRSAGEEPSADLVLRVPAPRYAETLVEVSDLGEVVEQSASAEDVSEQVVDLEGRIATARTSVERLRGFLDRAATVTDIASLEGELSRREAELESLEGRLAVLDDQVQLSTISVSIDGPGQAAPAEEDEGGFVGGLRKGWRALQATTAGTLVVVGALLPFVPIAFALALAWRLVDRRRHPRPVPAD